MPRDPSSPTAVEQGFGQVPCPPSTNSSTSGRNDTQGNGVFGGKGPSLQGVGVQNVGGGICNPGMSPMMQGNVGMSASMMGSPPGFQCGMPSGSCLQPEGANLSGSSFQPGAYCQNPSFSSGPYGQMPSVQNVSGTQMPSFPYPVQKGGQGKGFFQSNQIPGGLTQPMANVRQIVDLLQTLDGNQTRVLQQMVSERVAAQSRGLPAFFGDYPRNESEPFIPDLSMPVWEGNNGSSSGERQQLDVFSKSEKWLTPAPVPQVEQWKSREQEVLGWHEYLTQLVSWAAQASEIFAHEISQSSRWDTTIGWQGLTSAQKSRSSRLFSILKAAFVSHPRTSMLTAVFAEGLNLQEHVVGMLPISQANANGFELVRQLTLEFSLKTRGEALGMRSSLASKSFVLGASETSVGTIVTDTIRKLDFECSRYVKMLATLPTTVDSTGLALPEADMLLMLLRSLPQPVRDFCLHHASGDSFVSYRQAAKRWEQQQRIFQEMSQSQGRKQVSQLSGQEPSAETEFYDTGDREWENGISAVSDWKCQKCGSKKHSTTDCTTGLSKTKCFRCNGYGHVSMNCNMKRNDETKGKGNGSGKSHAKGGKGNRKGKLYEVSEEYGDWWSHDWDWNEYDPRVYQVSGWEQWDEYGWDANEGWYDGSETWESGTQAEPSNAEKTEKTVGSLVLSPVLCLEEETSMTCGDGLFLEDVFQQKSQTGFGVSEITHEFSQELPKEESIPCGSNSNACPQPFCEKGASLEHVGLCPQLFHYMHGLKSSEDDEIDSLSGDFHDGLICEAPMRVKVVKLMTSTFMNHEGELSACHEWSRVAPTVLPLLSEVGLKNDFDWWLLDSGAAVTVLVKHCFTCYAAEKIADVEDAKFSAANGSSVKMHGKAEVSVFMNLWHDDGRKENSWKKAKLVALVGETRHNILSTTTLSKTGWCFSQKNGIAELFHEDSGLQACEVVSFAGCPWVRLHPHSGVDKSHDEANLIVDTSMNGYVCPLSKAARNELEQHRNQGHTPHNPHCVECSRGRSTFQHRRRDGDHIESEIQADFGFLSQTGEVADLETSNAVKILVLTETVSNAIGYVVVEEDLNRTRNSIVRWLKHFGMESEHYSIVLHTDAEQAVRNLVAGASSHFTFQVRKAGNQQRQSVGSAERGVRRLKETLSVLRADLNQNGLDIRFDKECIGEALNYLALVQNHFGKTRETDLSPLEVLSGRRLSKPVSALFGSTVLAELPTSLRQRCPNETRSIEAAYISCGLDKGPMVMGFVRIDQEVHLMQFAARNVRQITPISWDLKLCDSFLAPMVGGEAPQPVRDAAGEV